MSRRYQPGQHREVAKAVHAIGQAPERPVPDADTTTFPREQIRLFAAGCRLEVRLVVGTRHEAAA